ncbi:MAG: type II toxin-antitoxin system PemK/MazF family toxin [Coriobacteriia bacterium]|nr:type II toxin-antitoxin system PemK/MazF family toxin [Coriobacteriia bacterium]
MQRGEIWTLQDDRYASKARPVVIIQGSIGDQFDSIILCLFTSYDSSDIPTRVLIEPKITNGLVSKSYVMTEKIVTVARTELGTCIGKISPEQLHEIGQQIAALLDIKSVVEEA